MKEALNLVYNNLPPHLKACLLHLNIYPEGWTVKKDELVKQWVAEGFIGSVQRQDREETAGCYFDALVSTGMLQSVDTSHNDEVLSCTLHHMVLDLIRQKSMEENFVTIVNYFQTVIGLPDKVRRLSVQLGGAKGANNISGNMRISQVRSLIFFGFLKSVPSIMDYGLLQVLILHIWSDQDRIFDLTTLGELYRLRYLKIECSIIVKLPHKIRRLQQLSTLQVDARLYAVPSDIVHLEKLLHLRLPSESVLPHGVGRMTCLRTLGHFDLCCNSEASVRDLGELKNLQDLQLTFSAVQPAERLEKNVQLLLGSVLKQLSMLQSLTLVPAAGFSDVNTLQDGAGSSSMIISCDSSSSVSPALAHLQRLELSRRCCILSRLPKWLGELTQLCILKIAVVELSKDEIDILKGLPALASLSLHVSSRSTEKIVFGKEGFSVLRYFKLTCTTRWLKFGAGAMPNLEKLKLCFNLRIKIIIIGRLSGLKEVSAIIGGAGVDAESFWQETIINDPSNPKVHVMGMIHYGDQDRGMDRREGLGEDEKNEADIRVHMKPKSSRLPVPEAIHNLMGKRKSTRWKEEELEDPPFITDIISIPSESESTDGPTDEDLSCVSPSYMSHQTDINEKMRGILIDWLIEIHYKLELLDETLFLTVNIIDRYLACENVARKKLQLVGITAMMLASKYVEVFIPVIEDMVLLCDRAYTRVDILEMERTIVDMPEFDISVPTPYCFMRRFLKAAKSDRNLENLSFFIIELSLVDYGMIKFRPSMLAAAAIYTAQSTINGFKYWNKGCELHTKYSEEQLMECSRMMVELHRGAAHGKLTGVHRKYSTFKYGWATKSEPAVFLL